jgi:negative regulator of sigma E activity
MTDTTNLNEIVDPNKLIDPALFKFRFKKDKLDNQRPSIELNSFVPSFEGIVAILQNANTEEGKKEYELLRDSMYEVVRAAALEKISNDEKLTAENFPYSEISWKAIANQDRADRRASSIPAELWNEFAADYIEIMPALTNKSVEAVTTATVVYLKKFAQIKTEKKSLEKLKEQLAIYTQNTKRGEDFAEILDLLDRKVNLYLKSDDVENLIANL